jgi:hypothetical protein
MAKQTYKTMENQSSVTSEIGKQADEALQKIKYKEQKQKFDQKIQELADQAAVFYNAYGEEDWRTSLLVNFLDLSLQMKDIIEIVTAFNVANEIIFHAMNLMNTSLSMTNGMMLEVGQNSVSPFKQKMIMRRAIRNNKNTVKNMIEQMKTSIQMASLTADMYQDLSVSITGVMNKLNNKREKKKTKNVTASTSSSQRGMDMVRGIASKNGAPASAAPKPATSSGTDSGLDGVL